METLTFCSVRVLALKLTDGTLDGDEDGCEEGIEDGCEEGIDVGQSEIEGFSDG
jgi:flagellar biosynthesis/type III secretory pathway protein FliH